MGATMGRTISGHPSLQAVGTGAQAQVQSTEEQVYSANYVSTNACALFVLFYRIAIIINSKVLIVTPLLILYFFIIYLYSTADPYQNTQVVTIASVRAIMTWWYKPTMPRDQGTDLICFLL